MKRWIPILLLILAPAFSAAVDEETVYGVYSLPGYEVDDAVEGVPLDGWSFGSASLSGKDGSGLEAVTMPRALIILPGLEMSRRGAATLEPVVRGLGGERVATFFNGLRLPGGSPTHLAPIGFFFPGSVADVSVTRAFPSVTGGTVTTSGRIDLEGPGSGESGTPGRLAASARSGWEGGNLAASGEARVAEGCRVSGAASGAWFGDYRTGGDDWVDADFRMSGLAGTVVWNGPVGGSTALSVMGSHQFLTRNASLPLDMKDTSMFVLTLETSWEAAGVTWAGRLGYAVTRPYLTSEDRPIMAGSPIRLVTARSEAKSLGGRFSGTVAMGGSGQFEMGLDLSRQVRDSTRVRSLVSGAEYRDRIWPELETTDLGAFAEVRWNEPEGWRLVGGVRLDRAWSDALAADDPVEALPGARGATIRENYGGFNGPEAEITARDDWAGAASITLEVPVSAGSSELTGHAGIGMVRAAPGEGDRYRAFLNALGGGMEVGNPSLGAETRWEADLGVRMEGDGWRLDAGGFLARVDGFIQREAIASGPLVYGFRNRDVALTGLELISEWTPGWLARWGMGLDGSFAFVRGRDRATSVGLPEIPPWDIRAGFTWKSQNRLPRVLLRMETRIVGARTNPDPEAMPLYRDTEDFDLWNLRSVVEAGRGWQVELSIENLFDRRYHEYLQAPVADGALGPSSGTLNPGDSIPGMGRQFILSVRKVF
ncbi:MAG: TonB-dependent receptor [Opitutaceae bacterium]